MMWLGRPNNEAPGAGVCTLAVTGLLWQGWKWRLRQLDLQRRRQKEVYRSSRQHERRTRDAELQERRQRRSATDSAAHERARMAENARRQEETERAKAEERLRRERDEAVVGDTARLMAMDEAGLRSAAIEALRGRGFKVEPVNDEAGCDFVLRDANGGLSAVARKMPGTHTAEAADIQALEAWRRDEGAATAYLIGAAGFATGAIRLAASLPVMLVEPHLLAQWRAEDESGRCL